MKAAFLGLALALTVGAQSTTEQDNRTEQTRRENREPGPGRQVANGAGNIGVGAAKGAGHLAKGGAKAAGDLATLHPIDAAVSAGKGAVAAGKDVGVGTVKGTSKMAKGIGRAIKHVW